MANVGIGDFVGAAFKVPYNIILFLGGIAAGVVSQHPEIVWPLVAAGEIVYIATMSTNARFQAVVRAQRERRLAGDAAGLVPQLLDRLSTAQVERFERVRRRCLDLQRSLQTEGRNRVEGVLEGQLEEGVNKLLWVFLRTLVQQQTLANFCDTMPREEIEATLRKTEAAMQQPDIPEAMKAAHEENAKVLRQRLENLHRAQENLEAVAVRLVRVENSIMLVQEQALTRRDPTFVESEVRSVTDGLHSLEEMMRSMDIPQAVAVSEDVTPDFMKMTAAKEAQQQ
jgi:hypothetical protein